MAFGKADLRSKVLCCPGMIWLIIASTLHIVFGIGIVAGYLVVTMKNENWTTSDLLFTLVSVPLSIISGIGAILFLCVRSRLAMVIGTFWPALVILGTGIWYGIMIGQIASGGVHDVFVNGFEVSRDATAEEWILIAAATLIIPLSLFCILVLSCIGCCQKNSEPTTAGSVSSAGSKGKKSSASKSPVVSTPNKNKNIKDRSGHLY